MSELVYKICGAQDWARAKARGRFEASPDDTRDGFIHLSSAAQLAGTAARHFAGKTDLVIVALRADRLGDALKWEPSRGGDLFPHLYGDLDLDAVAWVTPLPLGPDGAHLLPPEVRP